MKTAVALIIFKRPETTEKVFEVIRQAQPSQLFVIADGPRSEQPGEFEKCMATRSIVERVDWDCDVLKNYADVNMGTKKRVVSGLNWVFENVEKAIILEDDCLPNLHFFQFCEELLGRYENDTRVMHITGTNFGVGGRNLSESYYFSRRTDIWGWATWRRSWKFYDINMSLWPDLKKEEKLLDLSESVKEYEKKRNRMDFHYDVTIKNNWDIQWHFACMCQGSYNIVPNKNLVKNIGFGEEATQTKNIDSLYAKLETETMEFPLVHPKFFIRDTDAHKRYIKLRESQESKRIDVRIKRKLKKWLS